ncbi:T cell receptor beta variable 20-1, partial [Galemys pyrenaicus]
SGLGVLVSQHPRRVISRSGSSVEIQCSCVGLQVPTIFWYQQFPNQGLTLMAISNARSKAKHEQNFSEDKFPIERPNDTYSSLKVTSANPEDSSFYLCAVSDTELGREQGPQQELGTAPHPSLERWEEGPGQGLRLIDASTARRTFRGDVPEATAPRDRKPPFPSQCPHQQDRAACISAPAVRLYALEGAAEDTLRMLLLLILVVLGPGSGLGARVSQHPRRVISRSGSSVEIQCNVVGIQATRMVWYRQFLNQGLTMMAFSNLGSEPDYEEGFKKEKFSITHPNTSFSSLTVKSVNPEDSSFYLCAASDTELGREQVPQQELHRAPHQLLEPWR